MDKPLAFKELKEFSTRIETYQSVLTLLHWDQETYMPSGAIAPRSQQIAEMSSLVHEEKTGKHFKNLLEKLAHLPSGKPKIKGLSKLQLVALREWVRDFTR